MAEGGQARSLGKIIGCLTKRGYSLHLAGLDLVQRCCLLKSDRKCDERQLMLYSGLVSITFRELSCGEIVALVTKSGLDWIGWVGGVHVPYGDVAWAR